MGLDDVLYTVFRHKWLILGFLCLGVLGAAAVRDTMGYLSYHQVPEQQQIKFAEAVEKLDVAQPAIPGVQESPSKLLEHIRQICPAVDKHYQSRETK